MRFSAPRTGRYGQPDVRERRRHQRRGAEPLARHVVLDDDLDAERGVITDGDTSKINKMLVAGSSHPRDDGRVLEALQREKLVSEPQAERQQRDGRHALQPPVLCGALGLT